jgi:hypothetical protein
VTTTERELRDVLASRAGGAPEATSRYAAVERRIRRTRRRRVAAAATLTTAVVTAAALLVPGLGGTTARPLPPANPSPVAPVTPAADAVFPDAFDGGTKVEQLAQAPQPAVTPAHGSYPLSAGSYALAVRCDTGEVTVSAEWPTGRSETTALPCTAGNGVEMIGEGWRAVGGGPLAVSVTTSEPQRSAWGLAVYQRHPRWSGATINAPKRLGALQSYWAMLYQGGGSGSTGTGSTDTVRIERGVARPTFLVECSGRQDVQVMANGTPLGRRVTCGPGVYSRHEVRPRPDELVAARWVPSSSVTWYAQRDGATDGAMLVVTVFGAPH